MAKKMWNNVIGQDVKKALQDIEDTERKADGAFHRAREAEERSQQAEQTATQANIKADLVQEQLNQVVIEGDSSVEAAQARVNARGETFETLKERLDVSDDALMNSTSSFGSFWVPPTMPSTRLGEGKTPSSHDPEANLAAYLDPLVAYDPSYVTKKSLGPDASSQWELWRYDFTPANYEKTIVLTACLHGNEYTGFYALAQFLELLVHDWHRYPALSYLRKNVRLVTVPIVNPWGFYNSVRQNYRGVDLNRNFPFNWESYSADQPGDTYYKGPEPLSEAEAQALDALFEEVGSDAVAHVDLHTIITETAEYILFMPRFSEQNHLPYLRVIQSMYKEGERIIWGTSSLPSLTNYTAEKYKLNSVLPEYRDGIFGQTRDSVEMTRAVTWYGNIILESAKNTHKAPVETLKNPAMKFYRYSHSPGSFFGLDGRYDGIDGEPVPINRVNHAISSTKIFSSEYSVFGSTSMKMTANNQTVNAQCDLPELTTGKYFLWSLYRRVTEMVDGHFGMYVYDIGTFNNIELVVPNATEPDLTWRRVGGVFEGRPGGVRLVYGRTLQWTGTVFVDGNMVVEITQEEYQAVQDGRLSLDELMDRYQFEYESNPPRIKVTSRNYQTLLPLEHRFDVKAPGLLLLEGSLTFTCSQKTEVGFIPVMYQPYAPHFSWSQTSLNPLAEVKRVYEPGTHTIPLVNQVPVQVSTVGVSGRTGEAVIRLRAKRQEGTVTVDEYRTRVTFLPVDGGMRYEIFDASKREEEGAEAMEKKFPLVGIEEGGSE